MSAGEGRASGPLRHLRVVEFAGVGPGPFCGMLLSDLGADVTRVHRLADVGSRPGDAGDRAAADTLGRGRRSVALDLKHPDGVSAALRLLDGADALIEGFRPGVMERLGLGPDVCLERRPALVYGRMTGWGQEGPYAHTAGHDVNYLALSGVLAHVGPADRPPLPPLSLVADFGGGGMLLALGIVAAVLEARSSGAGQVVDAAMVDGSALLMTMTYELLGAGRWQQAREANMNDGGAHFYNVYETADGGHVSIGAMEPKFYDELVRRLGLDGDLPDQWDQSQWPAMRRRFAEIFLQRTRAQWCELLEDDDTCFAPVLSMSEAPSHAHHLARGAFTVVDGVVQPAPAPRFGRTPGAVRRGAARPGEHTDEVLAELGFSAEQVAALRSSGAVG